MGPVSLGCVLARSGRPVLRIALLVTAAVLVVAVLIVGATALVLIRRPLPDFGGQLRLEGLHADVEIVRDARGVPQIYADDARDLFRAQGYVHAQDRFFEMDYRRRVTSGRLAELVGPDEEALASDSVVRTLGLREVAEEELGLLAPETVAFLDSYAQGVNDYLEGRESSQVALEYSVLGLSRSVPEIEPWSPVDSLAWLKGLAWDLRANFDAELERAALVKAGREVDRVADLFPPYPEEINGTVLAPGASGIAVDTAAYLPQASDDGVDTTTLAAGDAYAAIAAAGRAMTAVPRLVGDGDGIGSNAWVVSGELTASGRPLLANDPHYAVSVPGVLYQAGLHCRDVAPECPFDVAGFGYAGVPGIFAGRTTDLAWGLTAVPADVTDLFLERVFDNGNYLRDGRQVPLETRTETIAVAGEDDVRLVVNSTVHGPVISDVVPHVDDAGDAPVPDDAPPSGLRGYSVSLGWTALTPGRTMDAVFALDLAQDAESLVEAAADIDAPVQGIVFATTDGEIGFQTAGRVPRRAGIASGPLPSNGTWPRPGWDSRYDWVGVVDPADLPGRTDPGSGYIVAANQAVQPAGDGPFLTTDWDPGYRAQRIATLLDEAVASGEPMTVADMEAIQNDTVSPYAEMLVPYLLRARTRDAFVQQGVDLLRDWDGTQPVDSAAAAFFNSVWANLLRLTFWDDMPEGFAPDGGGRWLEVVRGLLEKPQSPWWDDRSTINVVESRDEVLGQALIQARRQLTVSLGKEPTRWEWGRLHVAAPEHVVLGEVGTATAVRNLVNPRVLPLSGGPATVRATAWDARVWDGDFPDFEVSWAPAMRMVVDLADPDGSTWVNATGSSGHPGSRNYTDQFEAWADGRSYPWPFTEEAVRESSGATRLLRPAE